MKTPASSPFSRRALAAIVAGCAFTAPAAAQSLYAEITRPGGPGFFGDRVTILGDTDGDGYAEWVVGTREDYTVHSGRTGLVVKTLVGTPGWDNRSVARAGDVNADGIPDLLIGKSGEWGPPDLGEVRVVLGGSWETEAVLVGPDPGEVIDGLRVSTAIGTVGDIDGDGHDDFAVGNLVFNHTLTESNLGSTVKVFSGNTFRLLREVRGVSATGYGDRDGDGSDEFLAFGLGSTRLYSLATESPLRTWLDTQRDPPVNPGATGVAAIGDLDGDGVTDVAVGEAYADNGGLRGAGKIRVYSGARLALIRTIWGTLPRQGLGGDMARIGDLNGDGVDEVVTQTGDPSVTTQRSILDLTNGQILHTFTPNYCCSTGVGGDINADGVPDAVLGNPFTPEGGWVRLLSGKSLSMQTDSMFVSAADGGTYDMTLDAGPSFAGQYYIVLGACTGTSPGTTVGGITVPLNQDAYFYFTLHSPNVLPLVSSLGVLDENGRAQASLAVPPGVVPEFLLEETLDHAFVVFSDAGVVTFASNPMPLTIVR